MMSAAITSGAGKFADSSSDSSLSQNILRHRLSQLDKRIEIGLIPFSRSKIRRRPEDEEGRAVRSPQMRRK